MTTDKDRLPLPPGNRAFPLLGETLAFLRDPFGFIGSRIEKHGPVFRTHILGRTTVVLAGPLVSPAFLDEAAVQREGSMPPHVQELFGGRSLPLLDGEVHRARKQQILAGFTREAIASYLPAMQELCEAAIDRWASRSEVLLTEELKRLSISAIARNMVSLGDGDDLETLLAGLKAVTSGFAGIPVALPGTAFKRGLAGRDAMFAVLLRLVADHRRRPHDDGLARILAARTGSNESECISDEDAARELHHLFLAGYIVFAELAALIERLTVRPDLADRVAEEVRTIAPDGAITGRVLAGLPLLHQLVLETKRATPVVPVSFAKAKATFEVAGYRVPEGTMLFWAPFNHDQDPATFPDPELFDPSRFAEGRPERALDAFAPQGMGRPEGHRCPGIDYATVLMETFTLVALRRCRWSLPEQDLGLDLAKLPPEHNDGLRVVFQARASASAHAAPAPERRTHHREHANVEGFPHLREDALIALASVVWADGVFTAEEACALIRVAEASGLDEAGVARVTHATKERHQSSGPLSMEPHLAEHLFSLACLIAAADGSVDTEERVAIRELGDRLGLDDRARNRASLASHAVAEALGASRKALTALATELEDASRTST